MAALLALGAAFCFASASIVGKFATRTGNAALGFLFGLVVTLLGVLGVAVVRVETWTIRPSSFVLFAVAGVLGTALGKGLSLWGVRTVGASVAVPMQSSVNPLVATVVGTLVLREATGPSRLVPLAFILAGIWMCARGGSANRIPPLGLQRPTSRLPLLIPLAAGASYASGDVLRKIALDQGSDPLIGAVVGTSTAVLITAVASIVQERRHLLSPDRSLAWYAVFGLFSAAAQVLLFTALDVGDLSAVSPIISSQPVITVILSALLLRNSERLRPGTVFGSLVVFAGVWGIGLSQP